MGVGYGTFQASGTTTAFVGNSAIVRFMFGGTSIVKAIAGESCGRKVMRIRGATDNSQDRPADHSSRLANTLRSHLPRIRIERRLSEAEGKPRFQVLRRIRRSLDLRRFLHPSPGRDPFLTRSATLQHKIALYRPTRALRDTCWVLIAPLSFDQYAPGLAVAGLRSCRPAYTFSNSYDEDVLPARVPDEFPNIVAAHICRVHSAQAMEAIGLHARQGLSRLAR
jgi:hypothetical protein